MTERSLQEAGEDDADEEAATEEEDGWRERWDTLHAF
jgi:hypothetical protein